MKLYQYDTDGTYAREIEIIDTMGPIPLRCTAHPPLQKEPGKKIVWNGKQWISIDDIAPQIDQAAVLAAIKRAAKSDWDIYARRMGFENMTDAITYSLSEIQVYKDAGLKCLRMRDSILAAIDTIKDDMAAGKISPTGYADVKDLLPSEPFLRGDE